MHCAEIVTYYISELAVTFPITGCISEVITFEISSALFLRNPFHCIFFGFYALVV